MSPAELEAERQLVLDAQRDPSKYALLYERYVDHIFAYCYNLTKDRQAAEDVTASTFAKAMEELPRFEWRGVPYSAWLYRVAANHIARLHRHATPVELLEHHYVDTTDPFDIAMSHGRDTEIRQAVAELPRDQREVIVLRFGSGLHNKEIAEIMGRSEGAVKLLAFRGLTVLRQKLGAPLPAERRQEKKQ